MSIERLIDRSELSILNRCTQVAAYSFIKDIDDGVMWIRGTGTINNEIILDMEY